jgi:putative acetyltransferase
VSEAASTPTIRRETSGDEAEIARLLTDAFGGSAEAELVASLRRDGDLLASLIATDGATIVGHVAASPFACIDPGVPVSAAALAPLAVSDAYRRRGIGFMLVQHLLAALRRRGIGLVFVLGDPDYYRRFGFAAETASAMRTPLDGPHQMAIELRRGAAEDAAGRRFAYAAGFAPFLPPG